MGCRGGRQTRDGGDVLVVEKMIDENGECGWKGRGARETQV